MKNKYFFKQKTVINLLIALSLVLLSVFALISVKQGLQNSVLYSQDFMWSPTVLLSQHRNPYQVFLDGNKNNEIILSQKPNYLHLIYILLLPFANLDWQNAKLVWGLTNTLFAIINSLLVCKIFCLNAQQSSLLILLFLTSTPFRNGVGNGQQQEIVLLFFLLGSYLRNNTYAAIFMGMSYLKYSFAPAIAQALCLKRGINSLLISIFVPLISALVFSLIILENPLKVLIQPFTVADIGISPGSGDLMTIIERTMSNHTIILFKAAFYLIPLAGSLLVGMAIYAKSRNSSDVIAYTAMNSLIFFKHLNYDYIFLLPMTTIAMTTKSLSRRIIISFGLIYHWYLLKIFNQINTDSNSFIYFSFFVNILMLMTILLGSKPRKTTHSPNSSDNVLKV